jgi:gliding motility-associated-like protein
MPISNNTPIKKIILSFFFTITILGIQCPLSGQPVANFILPDTSCVGAQINVTNLTTGGSTFHWDFCSGTAYGTPIGTNMGNPGNVLTYPIYITLVKDSNDCFSFVSNQALPRNVTRYYLGSSFRNDPVSWENLIPDGLIKRDCEAIQIKKDSGNWYGFINDSNTILRFDFGPSLWNNNPVVTDFGITAPISVAHCLVIMKEGNTWLGFLDADLQNKLYRLNFGSSLANIPVLEDLGNGGGLNHPCQFFIQQENGTWYMLIANFGNGTISRINFGNSLFNTPTGENLGNLGGIPVPDGITYLEDCDTSTGYFSAWTSPGSLDKLIFAGGISGSVTAQNIGDIGNLYYPSTFSEIFRQNDTLFTYVPNWNPSSMTRLSFPPCNNAPFPSTDQFTPPPFSYNQPGTYRVRLQVDAGLPDQVILCKSIVILMPPIVEAGTDQSIPYDSTTVLNGSITGGSGNYSYSWEPSSLLTNDTTLNPSTVKLTHDTLFILTATDLSDGCQGVDSVRIKVVHHEINENCLVFHNVITPNGDGLNDKWIIDCIENFPENKVTIYNRWGDKVNSFNNYDNVSQVWKGTTTDGKPLPDGTYYYVLTIKNGGNHCGWILLRGI